MCACNKGKKATNFEWIKPAIPLIDYVGRDITRNLTGNIYGKIDETKLKHKMKNSHV